MAICGDEDASESHIAADCFDYSAQKQSIVISMTILTECARDHC